MELKKLQNEWALHRAEEELRLGSRHRAAKRKEDLVHATEKSLNETRSNTAAVIADLEDTMMPLQKCFQKIGCESLL